MARIVRNNRIFENNQSEWSSNIHIMSTPVKFVRLYAVCRYIKMLIEENECPGLVSVDVVLNGKGFTKGSIVNKDIKIDITDCEPQDKRYIQIECVSLCFTFNKPVADVDITIHVMNIIYGITSKYCTYDLRIVRSDIHGNNSSEYQIGGVFSKFDYNGNYAIRNIEWVYNFLNDFDTRVKLPKDEIVKYDKTIGLSYLALNVFRSIKYNFNKHDIYLKDKKHDNYATIYLTVPSGKIVKDSEITRVCKIYENFVYADYNPNNIIFNINIEGTLIATVDTPDWLVKPKNSVFISNLDNRTNLTDDEYRNQYKS